MGAVCVGCGGVCGDGMGLAYRYAAVWWDCACVGAEGDARAGDEADRWRDVADVGASWTGGVGELLGDLVRALLGGDSGPDPVVAGVGVEGPCGGWSGDR